MQVKMTKRTMPKTKLSSGVSKTRGFAKKTSKIFHAKATKYERTGGRN